MARADRIDTTGIVFAAVLTVLILFPLFIVGVWAFTDVWRYPSVIPQEFGLRYWKMTLARADVWSSITMSLSLATIVTALSALICLPAAFAFARLEFPGRNILFFSFLAGHAFPKFGLLVAIAGIFLNLHLIGTFLGVVLIQLVGTLLFMIWIRSLPSRRWTAGWRRRRGMSAPRRCACSGRSPCPRPGRPSRRRCFCPSSARFMRPRAPG